ncbi:hypothetical protein H312_00002 [Anncaliia algerae PRA339]|uniref:Uncharacterized protein n=1 Tax=Anncaliia algerae PRA339 TaxID=1288291 RepID=A0A059F5R3_9MICR|nr:hypothetical protein H312_00002 [Anncaliia algerae PRA339]
MSVPKLNFIFREDQENSVKSNYQKSFKQIKNFCILSYKKLCLQILILRKERLRVKDGF